MKRFIKILFKVLLVVLIAFIIIMACGMFYLTRGLDEVKNASLSGVNPTSLADGTYDGKYDVGRWSNEVSVTIKEGKIINIEIVKDVVYSNKALWNEIVNQVKISQNTNLDAVSGATVTTKAYLKSIENALNK